MFVLFHLPAPRCILRGLNEAPWEVPCRASERSWWYSPQSPSSWGHDCRDTTAPWWSSRFFLSMRVSDSGRAEGRQWGECREIYMGSPANLWTFRHVSQCLAHCPSVFIWVIRSRIPTWWVWGGLAEIRYVRWSGSNPGTWEMLN